ncbi:MAG: hypothetical protein AB1791_21405, partial [Chloroflexota bacterium]
PAVLYNLHPPAGVEQQSVPTLAFARLARLMAADYPARDYYETAVRLGHYRLKGSTVPADPHLVGDRQFFTTDEGDTLAYLAAVTDHAYFWIATDLALDDAGVQQAADRFENRYYPAVVALFGEAWQPGVDEDPHFSVLHLAEIRSDDLLGYFDSGDQYPRAINSASNQQEIVYLNMSSLVLGEDLYFGTLAHELQHLIQWQLDHNETTWLDEGLAQLTERMVGLDTVDAQYDYLSRPATPLNRWEYEDEELVLAHYGAAYLFCLYLWEQLGEAAVMELARQPADGLAGVERVLQQYRPETTLAQFVADWAAATFLDDQRAGPTYAYQQAILGRVSYQALLRRAPYSHLHELAQFGVHYLELDYTDPITLSFAGDTVAEIVPVAPHSGQEMWLVPPLDNLDAQLTAAFDLTGLDEATLTFWTWYDLEEDWDYAYLSVSTNDGATWELLEPEHASAGEYGPALNGRSETEPDATAGWLQERISLDDYTGRAILLRFEVVTDGAESGRGFALDDLAIPELGYQSDVEMGEDGWQAAGFVRSGRYLPQQWSVQLIQEGRNTPPTVTPLLLDAANQGQWTLDLGFQGGVLVVVPLTPFIGDSAAYWLSIEQ